MATNDAYIDLSKTRNYLEEIDARAIVPAQVKEVIQHNNLLLLRFALKQLEPSLLSMVCNIVVLGFIFLLTVVREVTKELS